MLMAANSGQFVARAAAARAAAAPPTSAPELQENIELQIGDFKEVRGVESAVYCRDGARIGVYVVSEFTTSPLAWNLALVSDGRTASGIFMIFGLHHGECRRAGWLVIDSSDLRSEGQAMHLATELTLKLALCAGSQGRETEDVVLRINVPVEHRCPLGAGWIGRRFPQWKELLSGMHE